MKAKVMMAAAAAMLAGMSATQSTVENVKEAEALQASLSEAQNGGQQSSMQQNAQNVAKRAQKVLRNNYLESNPGLVRYCDYGVPPKVYGLYLRRTGKDKQNTRKNKHYAKHFA